MYESRTMSTTEMLMVALLLGSVSAQSPFQPSPSVAGGITFPLYSGSQQKDQWAAESTPSSSSSSQHVATVVPPPNQINPSQNYKTYAGVFQQPQNNFYVNKSKSDFLGGTDDFLASSRLPGYAPAPGSRNNTSRFFTLNTGRQTLDLGISFTVPFLSLPMSSLANLGQAFTGDSYTAMNSLLAINWPSVLLIGAAILGATLLLPQVVAWITSLTASSSSYTTSYGRTVDRDDDAGFFPTTPFASILNQIDDALAQYDLDSTSCMQRAVCSYVAGSEERVADGQPDSSELIISGLARSPWMQTILGQGSMAKAVELGRKDGGHCHQQFSKCPFSLKGVLKFLSTYASLTSSSNK